jgi:hypothetical protein
MANRKPLIDENGEVREIRAADVARFKPFSMLSAAGQQVLLKLRKRRPLGQPVPGRSQSGKEMRRNQIAGASVKGTR